MVAMQFGIDQDVPGCVPRFNKTKTIAWENYCRTLSDTSLYFPPGFSKGGVYKFHPINEVLENKCF
jgi:hypothetical protein